MRSSRCSRLLRISIILVLSGLGLPEAQAQQQDSTAGRYETQIFDRKVVLNTLDAETSISVDGIEMYRDGFVGIEEKGIIVGGVGVLIGSARNGGGVCENTPFIIVFPKNGSPKFEGPIEPCSSPVPTISISATDIVFEKAARASAPGKRWRWTPEKGLVLEETIKFAANQGQGWAALQAKKIQHPGNLLGYKDLYQLFRKTLGKDLKKALPAMDGPGSVEYRGKLVIGKSCEPHACDERQILLVADIPNKQLYVGLGFPLKGEFFGYPGDKKVWNPEAYDLLLKWSQGE